MTHARRSPAAPSSTKRSTRLADWQAQTRSALLKQRDLGADRVVLVLRATHANREALRQAGPGGERDVPAPGPASAQGARRGSGSRRERDRAALSLRFARTDNQPPPIRAPLRSLLPLRATLRHQASRFCRPMAVAAARAIAPPQAVHTRTALPHNPSTRVTHRARSSHSILWCSTEGTTRCCGFGLTRTDARHTLDDLAIRRTARRRTGIPEGHSIALVDRCRRGTPAPWPDPPLPTKTANGTTNGNGHAKDQRERGKGRAHRCRRGPGLPPAEPGREARPGRASRSSGASRGRTSIPTTPSSGRPARRSSPTSAARRSSSRRTSRSRRRGRSWRPRSWPASTSAATSARRSESAAPSR